MKIYLFDAPPRPQAQAFRQEYVYQNLHKLRLVATACLFVSSGILFLPVLFPVLNQTQHAATFRLVNVFLLLASVLHLALGHFVFGQRQPSQKTEWAQLLSLLFAFVFVVCCLSLTFTTQGNPKNTLTMYLLGLVTVAFLWDFEPLETLLLITLLFCAFFVGLELTNLSLEQKLLNHCVGAVILVCFFVLSRIMYSYRATHFLYLKEIEEKNLQLQKVSQAKSEVLGVVAHDLRSPFNNIEMMASMLRKKSLSAEKEKQFLDLILTSCQTSRHIINELLYLAREEQQESIPLEKLDICDLLQKVEQEWQTQLQGSRALRLSHPPVPLYANLNQERFRRVLDNLLSNAVKFTVPQGEIVINVRQQDKRLLLEIADKGIGIPEKFKATLFDRFSKARRRGLQGEKSTGLGLSICRQLVEQHGGYIDVESKEHQGTTFQIMLPAAV